MATIVPISHSVRWRSRSRGSSIDMDDLHHHHHHQQQQHDARRVGDDGEWAEEPSDDEVETFDEPHTAMWLVVPREFANTARSGRAAPVSPHADAASYYAAKSMERRRADGSDR